ncbi:AN1-type zinc finger protein 6 [Agrilus planipennis]|uniref:AN1-type zinc finger protein 6 n=1 Tax=Agrilus planipennis TaxID=224129 RepID=A0A1W4XNU2_AGRPL|nr:AN1-type zinc finger protein 6 [Agrilus planipennis]XP_018334042.1 AN1-type zinc finger protein 6 [Agrilus planipennis]XP_018334051.1 AN1-type zinc finger protein 6 [Agrilus planipennis]XP_018334060.1 AN1-type zinc finger protein 6 [Agrilus planipennis]
MEKESNPMQALCRSGCGFYGSPATDGLCSLCYKEALKKKQQPPVSTPSPASSVNNAQSFASFMDAATATAQPTIPTCHPSVPLSASTDSNADLNKETDDGVQNQNEAAASGNSDVDSNPGDKDGDKDAKKKKNRCAVCRKKVGLTGFECRCGGLFCAVHRYSDKHECTFDYREMGAKEIRRNNPVVVGEKIQKI